MSRRIRFFATVLVFGALTCGGLGALPLRALPAPAESARLTLWAAVVEWVFSILTPEPPSRHAAERSQAKSGSNLDPNGCAGCS